MAKLYSPHTAKNTKSPFNIDIFERMQTILEMDLKREVNFLKKHYDNNIKTINHCVTLPEIES